jgi:[NiFe] hydrogenase assembly HybE family chaperone
MTELTAIGPETLVAHFRTVALERMQGLPIVNPRIEVEAVGFRDLGEHRFGVLIAPWFMNMLILPGTDEWASLDQGTSVNVGLPEGEYDFTVTRDEASGENYLSAILFRTMADFPDQDTARAVAEDIVERLYTEPEPPQPAEAPRISRRGLLSGQGTS